MDGIRFSNLITEQVASTTYINLDMGFLKNSKRLEYVVVYVRVYQAFN